MALLPRGTNRKLLHADCTPPRLHGPPPITQVWRYYLVPVESREPQLRLSFTDPVYMLDGKTTGLQRCEVHYLAPADTPPAELRLRIRDDVITVDSAASMPTWEHAVQARMRAVPALRSVRVGLRTGTQGAEDHR